MMSSRLTNGEKMANGLHLNNGSASNGLLSPDPPVEPDMDSDQNDDIESQSMDKRTNDTRFDDRIKRRAKRPSKILAQNVSSTLNGINGVNGMNQVAINGVLTNTNGVSIRPNANQMKKFTKNSRRPRGRFGRGLTKKGISLIISCC